MADKIVASLLMPVRGSAPRGMVPPPLAELGALVESGSVGFSLVRIDETGTVAAKVALSQLDWCAGQSIRFDVSAGLLVVGRASERVSARIPSKMGVVLPARLRSRCRMRAGEQVLLASLIEHDLLVVYPQHVLHAMVTGFHASLLRSRDPQGG
ncbi:hypothetical protein [Amycolatopsis decaplanina]|uniref:hypothetical protein n=1 Tax=Amycolatopsis decaplanina TaxID=208441 RepID=UPI001268DA1E|nr:hypothetical protein [Amycolatopsis decaplanina]